jgi:hypothetical protein
MRPLLGESSAPIMLKKVLLPEPDGPITAMNSPRITLASTPRSACVAASPLP